MKLLTKEIEKKLPALYSQDGKGLDAIAHVKFFAPAGSWTWYASEASAILSDGRQVSLADAHEILRNVRGPGDGSPLPIANHALSKVSQQGNRGDQSETGYHAGAQSQLARGPAALERLHLPGITGTPASIQERSREASGSGAGREAGPSSGQGGDRTPRERDQDGRRSGQPRTDDAGSSSETSRDRQSVLGKTKTLEVVDVIFFGLVVGHERELGNFSLDELEGVRLPFGLKIERDTHWQPRPLKDCK